MTISSVPTPWTGDSLRTHSQPVRGWVKRQEALVAKVGRLSRSSSAVKLFRTRGVAGAPSWSEAPFADWTTATRRLAANSRAQTAAGAMRSNVSTSAAYLAGRKRSNSAMRSGG